MVIDDGLKLCFLKYVSVTQSSNMVAAFLINVGATVLVRYERHGTAHWRRIWSAMATGISGWRSLANRGRYFLVILMDSSSTAALSLPTGAPRIFAKFFVWG